MFLNAVPKKDLHKNAKVVTYAWELKKKLNGTYMDRLNAWVRELLDDKESLINGEWIQG